MIGTMESMKVMIIALSLCARAAANKRSFVVHVIGGNDAFLMLIERHFLSATGCRHIDARPVAQRTHLHAIWAAASAGAPVSPP
jgi:hypothetical protein